MLSLNQSIISNIVNKVGMSIEDIYSKNPVEIAKHIEEKTKKKLSFHSEFPFIGRGNVLRDGIVTSRSIDKEIDGILGIQ